MTAGRSVAMAVASVLLLGLPLILFATAVPRFFAGLAVAPVQQVLIDRLYSKKPSQPVMQDAQAHLADAMPDDGESKLWRAELIALLARNDEAALEQARGLTIEGLGLNPSNPRGWTLLCEIDVRLKRSDAADCMDTAFYIGPFDWFVARRRSALAVHLWPGLDADTKAAAARRMRLIWENLHMRDIVYDVDQDPNGSALLTAAFAGDKDELRAVNRWLINMRLWGIERDKVGGPP